MLCVQIYNFSLQPQDRRDPEYRGRGWRGGRGGRGGGRPGKLFFKSGKDITVVHSLEFGTYVSPLHVKVLIHNLNSLSSAS